MEFTDGELTLFYSRSPQSASGSDSVPLLFLHGAIGSSREFSHLLPSFSDRECILIDFPAHGESTAPSLSYDSRELAATVLRFLQQQNIYTVDIIGYSLGGYVGIELALHSPIHVRSIVSHAMKFFWTDEAITTAVGSMEWSVVSQNERRRDKLNALHVKSGAEQAFKVSQDIVKGFRVNQLTIEKVKELRPPILLSVGDHDELVSLPEILKLYQGLGQDRSALSVLANTRHPINTVSAEPFAAAARQFWKAMI